MMDIIFWIVAFILKIVVASAIIICFWKDAINKKGKKSYFLLVASPIDEIMSFFDKIGI